MSISELGSIGEFIGAIGVVVTLIYLAYQIRQNTEQLEQSTLVAKAAAINASNIALRENRKSVFQSSEMTQIFVTGNETPEELSEADAFRYRLLMLNITDSVLDTYTQTLETNFSPEIWHTQGVALVERVLSNAGGRRFWSTYAGTYPSGFRKEVNKVLEGTKPLA